MILLIGALFRQESEMCVHTTACKGHIQVLIKLLTDTIPDSVYEYVTFNLN